MKLKLPCMKELEQRIASLPFDVLIRRVQSSSLKNPSRSLEAHFFGVLAPSTASAVHNKRQHGFDEGPLSLSDEVSSPQDLRELLSQRLLSDIRQSRTRLKLDLDDLSLILANAVRHGFSENLIHTTLELFMEDLSAYDPSRQIESISRVMEASCEGLAGKVMITWCDLANLVAIVEQRMDLLTKSPPLCCLMVQFFAVVVVVQLPIEKSTTSVTGKFTADPLLLKDRCMYLIHAVLDSLLEYYPEGPTSIWCPAELQRMCLAVGRLRQFEEAKISSSLGVGGIHSSGGGSSKRSKFFWKRSASASWDMRTTAHRKVSRLVTSQVLMQGKSLLGSGAGVHAFTLEQLADVFECICSVCSVEAVGTFVVPLPGILKMTIIADPSSMRHVVRIGEASIQVEGATMVLMEALRCVHRQSYVLTDGSMWDMWPRVCALLESTPLSLRSLVKECAEVLQLTLETAPCLPKSMSRDFLYFRLGVSILGTLLIHHGITIGNRLEEIITLFINEEGGEEDKEEQEEMTPSSDIQKQNKITFIRFFFILASLDRHQECERMDQVLHFAMLRIEKILRNGVKDYLTPTERTMLRLALKKVRTDRAAYLEAQSSLGSLGSTPSPTSEVGD